MPEAFEMTPAEYARHRGVSRQAISKLLGKKIPFREERGKKLIDAAAADRAMGETQERLSVSTDPETSEHSGFGKFAESSPLLKARTATEAIRARTAALEYDERIGRLLQTDDVMRAMEKCAAAIVRDIDQLPNFAEDIASAMQVGGVTAVRLKLKEIARNTRIVLAESMRLTGAEDQKAEQTI